ncbi:UNVERIFIED_CONTAM: hypothetical protein FKN15_072794 [Acipenser sinensis]
MERAGVPNVLYTQCILVLSALAPPCLGFDRPQYPRVLGASALRHLEAFRALCSAALGAMLLQSLGASASLVPRELHTSVLQRFNTSMFFKPMQWSLWCHATPEPRCICILGASRATRLGASTLQHLNVFQAYAVEPLVACCPRASVPQRFDAVGASRTPPLGA